MTNRTTVLTFAWTACLALSTSRASAADFIFPGIQPKASAGAGQTVSRGASSLFYNPANMILTHGVQPDLDVSLMQLSYSYQEANTATYSPVVLSVTTPLTTAGLSIRASSNWAFGFAVVPLGMGSPQLINGAPIELQQNTIQAFDLDRQQFEYRVAAGVAWRILRKLTFGLAADYYSERTSIKVSTAGTGHESQEASYHGTSVQLVGGFRLDFGRPLALGLSYKNAVTRKYSGSLAANTSSSDTPIFQYLAFPGVGYDPANIGFGAESRFGSFGIFLDIVHEMWSGGRGVYKQGLGTDSPTIDLQDTNDIAVGAKLWITSANMIQVAVASDGGNMGNGDPVPASAATGLPAVGGIQIGQIEAVPRYVASGGYTYQLSSRGYVELAATYLTGTRTVPSGYMQPGTFTLKATTLSVGVSNGF